LEWGGEGDYALTTLWEDRSEPTKKAETTLNKKGGTWRKCGEAHVKKTKKPNNCFFTKPTGKGGVEEGRGNDQPRMAE